MTLVRKAGPRDLDELLRVYAAARERMKRDGNPNQWGETRPTQEELKKEIARGTLYRMEEGGVLQGYFALVPGEDPTYGVIRGRWLQNGPYATLHKVAKAEGAARFLKKVTAWSAPRFPALRVDTHEDNVPMKRAIEGCGFLYCGVIWLEDGAPRLAFERPRTPTDGEKHTKSTGSE